MLSALLRLVIAGLALICVFARAYTVVGNGDDGSDLESAVGIDTGPLIESREKASKLLKRLNTPGIAHLGTLLPELERSPLFLVAEDITSSMSTDKGNYHSDKSGRVFARTLPQPHAATRFFPVALQLDERRLIALHIHEALHRALPASVRRDETVTSEITLAILDPHASHDAVAQTVAKLVPAEEPTVAVDDPQFGSVTEAAQGSHSLGFPSSIGYELQNFIQTDRMLGMEIRRSHVIESDLYPFGGTDTPFGLGIRFSAWETERGLFTGPLGLSARLRLWTRNRFEIGIWGQAAFNTLSDDELKNSFYGRDFYSVGLYMKRTGKWFYVENLIGLNFAGEATEQIAATSIKYQYGEVIDAKIRLGARLGAFDVGGFAELHLGDHLQISGGKYFKDTGRYRVVSVGPELSVRWESLSFGLHGRFVIDRSRDANLSYIGDLFGVGTAQGHLGTTLRMSF